MSFGRNSLTPSAARVLLFAALLACAGAAARPAPPQQGAQRPTPDAAPPPIRYLPGETRAQLDAAGRDLKKRTRLSVELAEARLVSAAAHTEADRFNAATLELGVYEAIVADAIAFVRQNSKSVGKSRDHFKRLEIALRAHVPRLETLRRSLPSQHALHVQATLDFVRDARAEMLDAFFDNNIVPVRPASKEKPPERERATGTAPPEREKRPTDQR